MVNIWTRIISIYLTYPIVLFACLILLYIGLSKKSIILKNKLKPSKKEKILKYEKPVNIICRIFIISCIVAMLYFYLLPLSLDLPNAINGKYLSITGRIENWDISEKATIRSVSLIDSKSGKEISLNVYYSSPMQKGEVYTIEYLPVSKSGFVVEKEQ